LKTGISDRRLQPAAAIVDPLNTLTMPSAVTAATGYDVLTHASEAHTARSHVPPPASDPPPPRRYDARPPYASPADRPVYVGGNPIIDVWVERSLELVGRYLR